MSLILGQWTNDVNSPLCEWPWGGYRHQFLGWKTLNISKPLTLAPLLDELPCVYLHRRPEVTCSDNFTYQGSRACMVSANPFINLFQNILDFLFIYTLQVGHRKASFVQGVIQDRESDYSFPDFPGLLDVLWKVAILEVRYFPFSFFTRTTLASQSG